MGPPCVPSLRRTRQGNPANAGASRGGWRGDVDPKEPAHGGERSGRRGADDRRGECRLRRRLSVRGGAAFNADDVIATFERVANVPNSLNSFAQFVRGGASVTKQ